MIRPLLLALVAVPVLCWPWADGTFASAAVQETAETAVEGTVSCPSRQPRVVSLQPDQPLPDPVAGSAVIDQRGLRFIPHVLPVRLGTRVAFLNSDPVNHNVFSPTPTKPFNLGTYPAGVTRYVTFDKPGVVEVLCNVHLEMSVIVIVLDTPYFVLTDADGQYRLEGIPTGSGTLSAWCEGYGTRQQIVNLLAGNNHVDVDIEGQEGS